MTTRRPSTSRLLAGLAPFLLVGMALPLMAPSCGNFEPGVKTFSKGSLIIPMDVCYQCTRQSADGLDTATANCSKTNWTSSPSSNPCPQALAQGDVIKAYGLVYQLIRADVAVYWIIDPAKTAVDGYDLAIQYAGGFPVVKLDWATGLGGAPPTTAPGGAVRYMGGPFVVDGTDAAKAIAVMQANRATFGTVNVHLSNVAFQASVSKTMAGGWSAGGTVAPKLALLDIGSGNLSTRTTAPSSVCGGSGSPSCVKDTVVPPATQTWTCISDPKNAEPVIREYLAKAGIGTGTAGGTAAGPHGEIYDRLSLADFQPAAGSSDWRTSAFGQGGYQVLWVPHWVAPGSCSNFSSACNCLASRYDPAQIEQVLATIGAFNVAGGDVFAECAGLGSFEGVLRSGVTAPTGPANYTTDYSDGNPATRFQSKVGVYYNQIPDQNSSASGTQLPSAAYVGSFRSPLLQVADFPFVPYSGAIEDYRPPNTTADNGYQPEVVRLIRSTIGLPNTTDYSAWDYFTLRPNADAGHGTSVYLAGHSYSGVQGSFQAAGSRLVLNTLFNLGAGCTASGVACDTGGFGACSRGVITCSGGLQVCTPTAPAPPAACAGVTPPVVGGKTCELCNGIDDDCDGLVDEGLEVGCYGGPPGTSGVGQCRAGVQTCQRSADGSYGMSACLGEVLPAVETCNGLDDDCDGQIDDLAPGIPLTRSCYGGPTGTAGVGICTAGVQTCSQGTWGPCVGEVTPIANPCSSPESGGATVDLDRDCNGSLDACGTCVAGRTRDCYNGPPGTDGVGLCHKGTQTCNPQGQWGTACAGEVVPATEICRNGLDENCSGPLPGLPLGDDDRPYCMSCRYSPDPAATETADCWTGPSDAVFESPATPASVCKRGKQFCQASGVFGACEQQTLPGPELCNGRDDDCNGVVDEGAQCGPGFSCQNGVCVVAACDSAERGCPEGYACGNGTCIAASCGTLGTCRPGTTCVGGTCVDPCSAITCGTGSTCAGGYCTGGACYAVGCPTGQLCQNGACVADACAGVLCPAGTFCRQGDCVQACAIVTCGAGEKCDADGFCVSDPCAGKTCSPTQRCVGGACAEDPCVGVACGAGQRCADGICQDDPCAGITCPVGECRDGQCFAANRIVSVPEAPDGGKGCGGCGGGAASPLAALGLLLALPLARRRRPGGPGRPGRGPRAGLLLALVGLAGLGAAGCTKEAKTFDPAACALLDPPLGTCETESRCIDFYSNPSHCGGCGQTCDPGNKCVAGLDGGTCAPATQVAPHLTSVSPASGNVGGLLPVEVTLTGERLEAGATLRARSPTALAPVTVPTQRLADGRLKASLDLSSAAPGTWTLQVVNPDNVISNRKSFGVIVPTPVITQVIPVPDAGAGATPPRVAAGGTALLRVVGTGLMVGSACKISGLTLPEREVPATLTATGLECELDLSSIRPGDYVVWVANDPIHVSAQAPFKVVSGAPVLDTITPTSLLQQPGASDPRGVTAFGSGFDVTSKVWFTGTNVTASALSTTFVDTGKLLVPLIDFNVLCGASRCPVSSGSVSYALEVRNGAVSSGQRALQVTTTTGASANSISPVEVWQGDVPRTITVTGSGLVGSTLQVHRPDAADFTDAPTAGTPTSTTLVATLDLIGTPAGSAPSGTWDLRVRFADTSLSRTFSLPVRSNQAYILATPSPAGAPAGGPAAVDLTVSNLRPDLTTAPNGYGGVRVRFFDPAPATPAQAYSVDLVPRSIVALTASTWKVTVDLPLDGRETKTYALAVVNPNGAQPSQAYSFTVLPGRPSVSGVACTNVTGTTPGCITATSARWQDAPVPVRIDGANFQKPDAFGNNGSQVRVSAASIGVVDQLLPAGSVTVTSSTRIDVLLDTLAAVPATYTVSVWNQGGALKPIPPSTATFTILQP